MNFGSVLNPLPQIQGHRADAFRSFIHSKWETTKKNQSNFTTLLNWCLFPSEWRYLFYSLLSIGTWETFGYYVQSSFCDASSCRHLPMELTVLKTLSKPFTGSICSSWKWKRNGTRWFVYQSSHLRDSFYKLCCTTSKCAVKGDSMRITSEALKQIIIF